MSLFDTPTPKKPAKLVIIIGMPGSGKSTYIKKLINDNPTYSVYDDYQGAAFNRNHDPRMSEHFGPLVTDLLHGKTVVVSDVVYCVPNELGTFIGAILGVVPNVVLNFEYFANDPEQCKKNVTQRNRAGRLEKELALIDALTKHYEIPSVVTMSVYKK